MLPPSRRNCPSITAYSPHLPHFAYPFLNGISVLVPLSTKRCNYNLNTWVLGCRLYCRACVGYCHGRCCASCGLSARITSQPPRIQDKHYRLVDCLSPAYQLPLSQPFRPTYLVPNLHHSHSCYTSASHYPGIVSRFAYSWLVLCLLRCLLLLA